MKKFPLISLIITLIILVGGIFLFSPKDDNLSNNQSSQVANDQSYEFYWSLTCPHCENVENFLKSWSGIGKIPLVKYEVNSDRKNAQNLIKRGQACNLEKDSMGAVPLLYTPDGQCFLGDTPIINYFEKLEL